MGSIRVLKLEGNVSTPQGRTLADVRRVILEMGRNAQVKLL